MDIKHMFSTNLRKFRALGNLSQSELANRAGLHRTYICSVEREKRSISLTNVQRIADALGIDAFRLFIEVDKEENV